MERENSSIYSDLPLTKKAYEKLAPTTRLKRRNMLLEITISRKNEISF